MADRPAKGTRAVDYVDVRDSKNINAAAITAVHSTAVFDNNINWSFLAAIDWSGTAGTSWNTAANWVGNVVPASGDDVGTVAGTPFAPASCKPDDKQPGLFNPGRRLLCMDSALTVSGTFTNNGTVVLIGNETVNLVNNTDAGAWKYVGDGSASTFTIKNFGANDYFDLTIDGAPELLPWAAA